MTTSDRQALPLLGRDVLASKRLTSGTVGLPPAAAFDLPETVVQFGTGAFLRGFVDVFLDEAIRDGTYRGRVVAIASTGSGRDAALTEQDGLYTLVVEGSQADGPLRECRVIGSVSRALSATTNWDEILTVARQPGLDFVFSNTTEIGIASGDGDVIDAAPPPSFPGKLTRFLVERGRVFSYGDSAGVVVIPCELIERNGDKLRDVVLTLAHRWMVEPEFAEWLERAVPFCNTLVDRIVPGTPKGERRRDLEDELGYRDDLMIAAEPYRLFAIEADASTRRRLRFAAADEGIVLTDDVRPYRERKVRILNGGHTILASVGLLMGCETVLDGMRHPLVEPFLRQLLFGEIVPSLDVAEGEPFARDVLLRFANPHLRHALRDITVQHTAKMRVRVVPSIQRLAERTGMTPPLLALGFAAYLLLLRAALGATGAGWIKVGADSEGEHIRMLWRNASGDDENTLRRVAAEACHDTELWHADLSRIPGFVQQVADDLVAIARDGLATILAARSAEHSTARGGARA